MTRLFRMLGLYGRRSQPYDEPPSDGADSGVSSGWHESSMELRRGLTVLEAAEPDCGPETRPFTYQVERV